MPNFGPKNIDLFCKTLWIQGEVVIDCDRDIQNVGNILAVYDVLTGRDLYVFGNANVVTGFTETKLIDKTGTALYGNIKNASVTIYNNDNKEFSSGFFLYGNGWVVSSAHGFLDGNVETKVNANSVYVSVTDMNGVTGQNMVLQATELYVDAAADLAVLKVPGVMTQPHLQWGNSIATGPGSRVYTIGNPFFSDHQSISQGLIRDNEFVRFPVAVESVLTSDSSYEGHSGSPIVDEYGKVVGVLTFGIKGSANVDVSTLTGGPSQRVAQPIISDMIANQTDYTKKGFLGANVWFPVNTFDIIDLGLVGSGFTTKGIRLANIFPSEPLSNAGLINDDIIVQVDDYIVGDLDKQPHPSTATWFKTPGSNVTVQYIRPPSTTIITQEVTLSNYPTDADTPLFGNFSGQGDNRFYNLPGTKLKR